MFTRSLVLSLPVATLRHGCRSAVLLVLHSQHLPQVGQENTLSLNMTTVYGAARCFGYNTGVAAEVGT